MASFDLIIKKGTVLDALSQDGYLADIGISGKEIRAIGDLASAKAEKTIWAEGKYVCPGFVDIQNHSDSYFTLFEIPSQDSLLSQGITTIAVGHCGASLAPLSGPEALKSVQKWRSLAGANLNWLKFSEYLEALRAYPLGLNVLSLVGHSTLRRGLIRDEVRPATSEEVKIEEQMLIESLESGAGGISFGLAYAHEVDASRDELMGNIQAAASRDKLVSVHLRSEATHVAQAVDEVVGLAEDSGVRVKLSHFKIRNRQNWPLLEQVLGSIDRAYQKGRDIFFDVYPYTTSWSVLYTYLPKWSYEGGRGAILQNLKNLGTREKILAHLKVSEPSLGNIFVAGSETNPAFIGKTLSQIAANQEVSVPEALLNVLSATSAQVIVFDHNLSEENLEILLKHPLSVVASDGTGYDFKYTAAHGLVHPRCFGTMPKFLSMVRDKKLMSWATAVKKITSRPAEKLRLQKRGKLQTGYIADVVVFDPRAVGSRASYENPYLPPEGIDQVIVNGRLAFVGGREQAEGSFGEVLKV